MVKFITKIEDLIGKRIARATGLPRSVYPVALGFDDGTAALIVGCCDGDGAMIEDDPGDLQEFAFSSDGLALGLATAEEAHQYYDALRKAAKR